MNILFINPPGQFYSSFPPLGLLYLVAVTKEKGYNVFFDDANIIPKKWSNIPRGFNIELVKKIKPDICCLSLYTFDVASFYRFISDVKSHVPGCKIIVGGPHASALPERTLKECPKIDVVVIGEGEETLIELLEFFSVKGNRKLEEIKGISFIENGECVSTPVRPPIPNIDLLPMPAYEMVEWDYYHAYENPMYSSNAVGSVITARGCPYSCKFCFKTIYSVRYRSPESVVKEIALLNRKYSIKDFYIADDTFPKNKKWFDTFCEELEKENLHIHWQCFSRVNIVDFELLKKMKEYGCYMISYGVESGSRKILEDVNKKITLEQCIEAVRLSKKLGFAVFTFFMIGHELEDENTVKETFKFASKLNATFCSFNYTTPYPKTKIWDLVDERYQYDWTRYRLVSYEKPTPKEQLPVSICKFKEEELWTIGESLNRKYFARLNYLFGNAIFSNLSYKYRKNNLRRWAIAFLPDSAVRLVRKIKRAIFGNPSSVV